MILIGLAGDHLELGSAVFLGDGVHYNAPFSQRLHLGFHAHNNIMRLAQAFKAITIAAKSIMGYHADLTIDPPPADSTAHLFSTPTRLDGDPLPDKLRFKCRLSRVGTRFILSRDQDDQRSGLYIASLTTPATSSVPATPSSTAAATAPDTEVVVKFTARYNAEAHRLLDKAGLAPRLHSCSRVYGELYMVVMEHLLGKMMWHWSHNGVHLARSIYADVEAAVQSLHAAGIVFGDLRLPNVICVPSESAPESWREGPEEPGTNAKLVDFDWAGVADVDRYPATLDDSLPDWASGVERYGVMCKQHDRAMLEELREACE